MENINYSNFIFHADKYSYTHFIINRVDEVLLRTLLPCLHSAAFEKQTKKKLNKFSYGIGVSVKWNKMIKKNNTEMVNEGEITWILEYISGNILIHKNTISRCRLMSLKIVDNKQESVCD